MDGEDVAVTTSKTLDKMTDGDHNSKDEWMEKTNVEHSKKSQMGKT